MENTHKTTKDYLDYDCWKKGQKISIGELTIKPKLDMGEYGKYTHGWVVCDKNNCNALPGATWARNIDEAKFLLHLWIASGYEAEKFWSLNAAFVCFARSEEK